MPWHFSADSSRITLDRFSSFELSWLDSLAREVASQLEHEEHLFAEQLELFKQQVLVLELQELHLLTAKHLLVEVTCSLSESEVVELTEIELDSARFSQQLQRFELEADFELEATARLLLALLFDFFDSATRSTKNLGG